MSRFLGRTAFVTGAGSGLGSATAVRLAEDGADLVLADLEGEAIERTAKLVRERGSEALVTPLDVTDASAVEDAFDLASQRFGQVDLAVNCAGVAPGATLLSAYDDAVWNRVLEVNLTGTYNCLRAALTRMEANEGGAIVNVASIGGIRTPSPGVAAYSASKHGVIGLTKSAARESAPKGIRVNAVLPGFMRTPMIVGHYGDNREAMSALEAMAPIGRIAEASEVAGVVAFLLSDDASFMVGSLVVVDGGMTL